MLVTDKPWIFVMALEGYNLCYVLLLCVTKTNSSIISRLLLLSMIILSIMIFGLSLLKYIPKLMILTGLLFKLGVVPLHTWILDVYEHTSFKIIAITDGIFKLILTTIFVHKNLGIHFATILHILGYVSLATGAILALHEHNIKRWLGSISIGHSGIIMCTVSASQNSIAIASLICVASYSLCVIVFCLSRNYLFKVCLIFAMVGLPPFHTFFAKVNLVEELLKSNFVYEVVSIMIYFAVELISAIRWIKNPIFAIPEKK